MLYESIVIAVLVMQCVLLGFARAAQIRELRQCLERVIRLVSLLLLVSDFNPVFIQITATAVDMQLRRRRIRVIPASIAARTSIGISPRRARARGACFGIRSVRQGKRWQEV